MKPTLPVWCRNLLLMAGYGIGHVLWFLPANVYWHPPAGWRFAFLALLPIRLWQWPLATELLVFLYEKTNIQRGGGSILATLGFALHRGLTLTGPLLLHRAMPPLLADRPQSMLRLLAAMMASALAASCYTVWWLPPLLVGSESALSRGMLFLQLLMGDFIGMLLIVPAALMVTYSRPDASVLRAWRIDVPLVLGPVLFLYGAIALHASALEGFFATMLCVVPVMYFAFRSGWRGVAMAFPLASCTVAACKALADSPLLSVQAQLLMGAIGISSLLLGASSDELRANRNALRRQNVRLLAANSRLDQSSRKLQEAARRNLDLSDDLRRWITSELHDELGQNLTVLQTRLALLERRTAFGELLQPVWEVVDTMRRSVSGLMSSLRPAGLDEFGLCRSLEDGSMRKLVESAGLAYDIVIQDRSGVFDHLDDHLQLTLYRSVQETATNTVRHGNATRFKVWLRSDLHGRVTLLVSDDGKGFVSGPGGGVGLQGIRDRVLAEGGTLRIRSDERGTRLIVKLRVINRRR